MSVAVLPTPLAADSFRSIKKAYRKKALGLHPDRNYGNVEDTTKLFAEVQSAYDILSDPQERSWYDSHRDAILREDSEGTGGHYEHNLRMTTADDIMKMFTRVNGRLDLSDSLSGFFGLLRDTFDVLAREEEAACEWEGLQVVDYPSFGYANDTYEYVVRPFYAAWNGFATKKNFSWKEAFRYSDAPDRRVRRMMEKENKRLREEGIREFNDAVRSLVAFVRRRDPRYIPNSQSEADRQTTLRGATAAQAARSRAANQAKLEDYVLPEWTKIQHSEQSEDSEDNGSADEHYECVACGKMFKSEKQFEAHKRSKKHQKSVQQLRNTMQKEDDAIKSDEAVNTDITASNAADCEDIDGHAWEVDGKDTLPEKTDHGDYPPVSTEAEDESDEHSNPSVHPSLRDLPTYNGFLKEDLGSDCDEYAPREAVEGRIASSNGLKETSRGGVDDATNGIRGLNTCSSTDYSDGVSSSRVGKAKEKRAKKAAQKIATDRCGTNVRGLFCFAYPSSC